MAEVFLCMRNRRELEYNIKNNVRETKVRDWIQMTKEGIQNEAFANAGVEIRVPKKGNFKPAK